MLVEGEEAIGHRHRLSNRPARRHGHASLWVLRPRRRPRRGSSTPTMAPAPLDDISLPRLSAASPSRSLAWLLVGAKPAAAARLDPHAVVVGFARHPASRPRGRDRRRRPPITSRGDDVVDRRCPPRPARDRRRCRGPAAPAAGRALGRARLCRPHRPASRRPAPARRRPSSRPRSSRTIPAAPASPADGRSCNGTSPARSASTPRPPGPTSPRTARPGGRGVIVAVLDTGVAYANHGPLPALARLHRPPVRPRLRLHRRDRASR